MNHQEEQGGGTPVERTHGKHILSAGSHVGNYHECLENQQQNNAKYIVLQTRSRDGTSRLVICFLFFMCFHYMFDLTMGRPG